MPRIFISYRREDSNYLSGVIASRLASAFGPNSIVLDVDNIPPGDDFRDQIKHELSACDLLIAVIGKHWLTVRDENGALRLNDPSDWVRLELETALGRESKMPVIPVLLDNVAPPQGGAIARSLTGIGVPTGVLRPPSRRF
jgi:hypothetical protein